MRTYIFIVVLSLAVSASPKAQVRGDLASGAARASISEEEALQIALSDNAEIRAAARRVAAAQSKVAGAGALDDPILMYRNWGTPLRQPWDWNQSQHMFMLQQTLPGGGKRAVRSQTAQTEVEVAKAELEAVRQDVAARVRKACIDLLRNRDELAFHQAQAALLKQALQSAMSKYTVGRAPQQDVLKAQIAMTKLGDHRIMLEQQRDLARAELNTLLGRDAGSALEVTGQYGSGRTLPGLLTLESIAIQNRPQLAAIRKQIEVAEAQRHGAELGKKPDFTVGLGYMLMPAGAANRNAYMAELSVSLPWLNRGKHEAEISQAVSAAALGRAELEAQRAAVFLQIQQALINATAAQKSLRLYRDTLMPQTEATFKAAGAAYETNQTDFLTLIDSENMMLDVRTSYAKAAAEFDARVAELERAIGAPIPNAAQTSTTAEVRQ